MDVAPGLGREYFCRVHGSRILRERHELLENVSWWNFITATKFPVAAVELYDLRRDPLEQGHQQLGQQRAEKGRAEQNNEQRGEAERERAAGYIEDYYAFLGPAARDMARALPTTPEAIKAGVKGFEDVGSDELILWPCLSDLEQVERLAALV